MGCTSSKHPAMYVVPNTTTSTSDRKSSENFGVEETKKNTSGGSKGQEAIKIGGFAREEEARKNSTRKNDAEDDVKMPRWNEPMTNANVFTLSSADQIIREEEYERQHSVNARNAVAPKNTKQQQKGKKKKRDASTSRASSTSPAPSLARAQHQHSSMNPSGSMPQYLGVPPPKSLSVLRRDAGESSFECANFATTHSSSSAMKRDDVDLNSEIDRYIMVTLLERERDVVRGKADVLRATSGKISSALEKERKSLKSKSGKENKKQKTLAATTATSTDPDPSSLQDSLSNVFGALFSGVAPATEEEQQKRNLLERSSSSDTTTTTTMHMNNDTSVQDLCGELLKNERFIHMHAASGSVLDSRFINGRRDTPGDWVEVAPRSPEQRKSRKSSSSSKKKSKDDRNSAPSRTPAAAVVVAAASTTADTATTATTRSGTNINRGRTSSNHNTNTRGESSKPKAPAAVDDQDYFSPIDTPKKQEMQKSSPNSPGNIANVTANIGADKLNTLSRSSSRSRLSNSASARDKMLNSSGASRSGGATDNNSNNNNISNTMDGSISIGYENREKELRTSPDSNLAPTSPREIETVQEERG